MTSPTPPRKKPTRWTKLFLLIHWTSGAISLVSVLFFALTGLTLNHADEWNLPTQVREKTADLPPDLLTQLRQHTPANPDTPPPPALRTWLKKEHQIPLIAATWEWNEGEIYAENQRPGSNSWLSLDLEGGTLTYEETNRGPLAKLNDLHRGLYTRPAWSLYLDLSALAIVVFSLTGLALLIRHAPRRPSTWWLIVAGLLLPLLLAWHLA